MYLCLSNLFSDSNDLLRVSIICFKVQMIEIAVSKLQIHLICLEWLFMTSERLMICTTLAFLDTI
jgi:hypothetical protein